MEEIMKGCKWNITRIIMEILKNENSISYASFSNIINVTEVTTMKWRKGETNPQRSNIESICDKLPVYLRKEEKDEEFFCRLIEKFTPASGIVENKIKKYRNLKNLLEYLYSDFEADLNNDKIHDLINNEYGNDLLRKIFVKKLETNFTHPSNFQIEYLDNKTKNPLLQKESNWTLDPEHCVVLRFKTRDRDRSYKVLVDFNYNQEEYENTKDVKEAKDAVKYYDVDMILLFPNFTIPKDDLNFCMGCCIYIEEINLQELNVNEASKDFIFTSEDDKEKEELANKYADLILGRFYKYLSVIFKNILFIQKKELTNKQQESFIFWDAKFVMRHHINFQIERIKDLYFRQGNRKVDKVLAIGYQSFPSILQLAEKFSCIYLLDNSVECISFYEKHLKDNHPELLNKIRFLPFTSVLFDFMSERYYLYESMDLILLGTGEGSFIKKLPFYYLICNSWLKPGGKMYISFLNRDFPYEFVDRVTIEENSEYIPLINEKKAIAIVTNGTERYHLFCETFNCNDVRDIAEKYFEVVNLYSYPLGSIIQSTHRSRLQNILKEYDKEYSKKGFLSKTFSNSIGYYLDTVLTKYKGERIRVSRLEEKDVNEEVFQEGYTKFYLKTIFLTDSNTSVKKLLKHDQNVNIYAILLPKEKKLPETDRKKVYIFNKTLRFLNISEINALGLEFKNISPFLVNDEKQVTLKLYYDNEISKRKDKFCYAGNGSSYLKGYKLSYEKLLKLLEQYKYHGLNL